MDNFLHGLCVIGFLEEIAIALNYMGRSEQAITQLKKAMRMNHRRTAWYLEALGYTHYELGRYREALATLKQDNKLWFTTHRPLAPV